VNAGVVCVSVFSLGAFVWLMGQAADSTVAMQLGTVIMVISGLALAVAVAK